jgi:GH18 family chitinase
MWEMKMALAILPYFNKLFNKYKKKNVEVFISVGGWDYSCYYDLYLDTNGDHLCGPDPSLGTD